MSETTIKRTPEEIEALKKNWQEDPCWEIEYTEGFEAHEEELAAWRREYDAKLDAEIDRMEARQRIQTIRTRVYANANQPTLIDDDRISELMSNGWVIQSVQMVPSVEQGDWEVNVVDRFVTLTRDPGVKSAEQQRIEKLEAALRRIEDLHSYELEQAYDIAAELLNVYTP